MVDAPTPRDELVREALFEAGFDIFHGPFSPAVYNDLLESEGLVESGVLSKLPEEIVAQSTETATAGGKASTKEGTETKQKVDAYLIGNTKHLWPIFLRWLYSENEMKKKERLSVENVTNNEDKPESTTGENSQLLIEDPLDTYEQTAIKKVAEMIGINGRILLYWSSDYHPSRMVSMARIASCTGFSYLDPHTHLSVHPTFGTWHSYRAVLLIPKEESSPPPIPIATVPNPVSPLDQKSAEEAFDRALAISTGKETESQTESSSSLLEEDRSKLSEELGRGNYKSTDDTECQQKKISDRKTRVAKAWISLREAISIGRETYRFNDNQLWYHYTKDPRNLFLGMKHLDLGTSV